MHFCCCYVVPLNGEEVCLSYGPFCEAELVQHISSKTQTVLCVNKDFGSF